MEIIKELPTVDYILVPVGGGEKPEPFRFFFVVGLCRSRKTGQIAANAAGDFCFSPAFRLLPRSAMAKVFVQAEKTASITFRIGISD